VIVLDPIKGKLGNNTSGGAVAKNVIDVGTTEGAMGERVTGARGDPREGLITIEAATVVTRARAEVEDVFVCGVRRDQLVTDNGLVAVIERVAKVVLLTISEAGFLDVPVVVGAMTGLLFGSPAVLLSPLSATVAEFATCGAVLVTGIDNKGSIVETF
jgi:hypothetical protein